MGRLLIEVAVILTIALDLLELVLDDLDKNEA